MKKRMLSLLLCLVMVLSLMPTAVFAAGYNVWVNDVEVTSANMTNVLGDGTVSYNPARNELTLNNAVITEGLFFGDDCGIYSDSYLSIIVKGSNTIEVDGWGIVSDGSITITGSGSLEITSASGGGIYAEGNLTIDGSIDLRVDAKDSGLYTGHNLEIVDAASLNIVSTNSTGIFADNEAYIHCSGNAVITATDTGIDAWDDLFVSIDGTTWIIAGTGLCCAYTTLASSGGTLIKAGIFGIQSDYVDILGSGDLVITASKGAGINVGGDLNFYGSGTINIYGSHTAVKTGMSDGGDYGKIYLKGTNPSIALSCDSGYRAIENYDYDFVEDLVTGSNFSEYTVNGSAQSNQVSYVRQSGVQITTQPASASVTDGSTATFKVVATGASSYQWQWRAGSTGTWKDCSSATSGYNTDTLKPVGTAARNGYQYRCVVKGSSGNSVTSNAATLKVLAITTQPANTSVSEGSTATFKVVATNAASYQWQWRAGASGTWANCSSATTGYNTATLKPVGTAARNGYQYRCIVKDSSGKSVTSNAATLTVKAGLAITTQPANTTVTEGSTATFKVVATGASSYQWQWRAGSTGTWTNCSSATSGYNTATLKPVGTAARNGYQYRCIVKDANGKSVTSNAATLTVKAGLAITTQPANTTVTEGSTATFKVVATGASSYQWQWRASSTGTWANCSSATAGYNTATLKPVGTAARNGYQYRCIVGDASGKSVTSNAATLTVKAGLAITTQPVSVSVTEGSTATFKVVATGASSYQWQWRTGSTGTWANCSSATAGYNTATLKPVGTAARNGYQYRCIVKDSNGKSVTSNTATLTVKAASTLAITTQPASVTVTAGSTATFKVVATGASSYQWQWRAGASGTWANCSSATSGYNTATLKPVGTAARNGYQYRCVVKDANGNSVTSNIATLTVK